MSGSRKQIVEISTRLAEEVGAQQGVEVVDVEYVKERGEYFLRVYIDKPGGVTLDDCEAFSVVLGERLDEVDPIPNSYSRSEQHTSELQSRENLVCRLLLEKKINN